MQDLFLVPTHRAVVNDMGGDTYGQPFAAAPMAAARHILGRWPASRIAVLVILAGHQLAPMPWKPTTESYWYRVASMLLVMPGVSE